MLLVGHFRGPVFYRPAAATMAWRVLPQPLGYSRKLGERLLDLGCELGDPSPTARRRRSVSVHDRCKAVYRQSLP